MRTEQASTDRTSRSLLSIGMARSIWLVALTALLCSTMLPQGLAYGHGTNANQEAHFVAASQAQTNGDTSASNEASETNESMEPDESTEDTDAQSLRNRLVSYTFLGGLTLVFLGLLFGYLRLNHATRGFHSGRLQLAAMVLSGIVLLVSYLLWTQVLFK